MPDEPAGPNPPAEAPSKEMTPEEERLALRELVSTLAASQVQGRAEMLQLLEAMRADIKKETEEKMNKVLDTILEATVKGMPQTNAGPGAMQVAPGATLSRGPPAPAQQLGGSSILPPWVQEIRQMLKEFGVLGNDSPAEAFGLDADFRSLFTTMQQQALLQLKNDYRKKLGLPALAAHVQEAGHA